MATHIVWDWNGTLLDDNDAVVASVNAVCAEYGRPPITLDHWRTVFRRPLVPVYEQILGRNLDDVEWDRLNRLYHDAYRDLLPTTRLTTGVPDVLRNWHASGRSQSLLSMWFHDELVPLVTEFGLLDLFAQVDGLRSEANGGSKAEHLRLHLTALGLEPSTVVLIGDVVDDAEAALQAGASAVLVTTGVNTRATLETAGVPVADSIPEALGLLR